MKDNLYCIPIGPQHPALKEPINFTVTLDGDIIVDADLRLGYNHRGIEKACEERNFVQCIYLTERICGICSHSHATNFTLAVEELLNLEVPKRAQYIRMLIGELERIHSHYLWLGVAAHEAGFDTLFMYTWRDREIVMDMLEQISGNRVNYGINKIGGVRRDIPKEYIPEFLSGLDKLEERTLEYIKVAGSEETFVVRLKNVGTVPHNEAQNMCLVGPMGRACGLPCDVRKIDPYLSYDEVAFDMIVEQDGDVMAQAKVRLKETIESIKICRYILQNLPDTPLALEKVPRKVPAGEVVARYEAPRGEDIHYVKSNGTTNPERVKVRAPTLANWLGVLYGLRGAQLADIPLIVAGIDPCISCTERIGIYRKRKDSIEYIDWDWLREYGIEWYKKHKKVVR